VKPGEGMLFYVNALFSSVRGGLLCLWKTGNSPGFPQAEPCPTSHQSALCSKHLGSSFIIKNESTLFPRQAV
jgi:hypothetical protein